MITTKESVHPEKCTTHVTIIGNTMFWIFPGSFFIIRKFSLKKKLEILLTSQNPIQIIPLYGLTLCWRKIFKGKPNSFLMSLIQALLDSWYEWSQHLGYPRFVSTSFNGVLLEQILAHDSSPGAFRFLVPWLTTDCGNFNFQDKLENFTSYIT